MNIHGRRIFSPEDNQMSTAVGLARNLEKRERDKGFSCDEARRNIARRLLIGVGALENIVRDRVKRVDASVRDRLQTLLVHELESEIRKLCHELEMARLCGSPACPVQIGEVEAHLAKAKELLRGET